MRSFEEMDGSGWASLAIQATSALSSAPLHLRFAYAIMRSSACETLADASSFVQSTTILVSMLLNHVCWRLHNCRVANTPLSRIVLWSVSPSRYSHACLYPTQRIDG